MLTLIYRFLNDKRLSKRSQKLLLVNALLIPLMMFSNSVAADAKSNAVIIVYQQTDKFQEIAAGLKTEWQDSTLDSQAKVYIYPFTQKLDINLFAKTLDRYSNALVIVLGNESVSQYQKVEQKLALEQKKIPPTLLLYCLYADEVIHYLTDSTVIRFEVPVVTSLVRLRELLAQPLKTIGVIHRPWSQEHIARNTQAAQKEGFEIYL